MKQRRLKHATVMTLAIAALSVGLFSTAQPTPVEAHTIPYGYFQCSQESKLALGHVRVGFVSPPADGSGDGVVNSFVGRAVNAASRMSTALAAASPSGHVLSWVGTISSANPAAIAFRVSELDSFGTSVLGYVAMSATCSTMHGTPTVAFPGTLYADVDVRSTWFTQDDSRRALWESCPANGYSPAYTCSKEYDVGGVMLHELGHALGLGHPEHTDIHQFPGGNIPIGSTIAGQIAKCSVANDQATMCAFLSGRYRSHWRTLDSWDTTSLSYRY
jgi:hypothetical protein